MQGFFSQSELGPVTMKHSRKISCLQCKLYSGCISPRMEPSGQGARSIYLLGEAPGRTDDEKGTQLVGEVGKFLQEAFGPFGINLERDCIKDNAIRCRPPKNREPADEEVEACRLNILESMKAASPKLILLFGKSPLLTFVGNKWKKGLGGINKWKGFVIPDREYNAWVAPLYHPNFVMRADKKPVIKKIFQDDLENALKYLNRPLPQYRDEFDSVKIVSGSALEDLLRSLLEKAKIEPFLLAFDYETTGKKPHAPGHEIVAASMCWDGETSYVFSLPTTELALELFKKVLTNPRIKKTAHNMKFEDTWTSVILKVKVKEWLWCSMQGGHILDNRQGISGLKFQTAVNFGLYSYDEDIAPYLESIDPKNANSFNRVREAPVQRLLTYCGIDSLVQYRLAMLQLDRYRDILNDPKFKIVARQ